MKKTGMTNLPRYILVFLLLLSTESFSQPASTSIEPVFQDIFGLEKGDEFLRSTIRIVQEEKDEKAILVRLSESLGQERLVRLLAALDQSLDKNRAFNRVIEGHGGKEDYRLQEVIELLRTSKEKSLSVQDRNYDELKARIEREGQYPSWARPLLWLLVFLLLVILSAGILVRIGIAGRPPDNEIAFTARTLPTFLIKGFNTAAERLNLPAVKKAIPVVVGKVKAVISLVTGKATAFISTVKETVATVRNHVKEHIIKILLVALGCWVLLAPLLGLFSYLGHGQTKWRKAEAAYVRKDLDYAKKEYLKATVKANDLLKPQLIETYHKLGQIALQEEDWNEAFEFYTRAISVSGTAPAGVFFLCQAYESRAEKFIQEFNYPKAVIFYKKGLEKLKEMDQANQEVIERRLRFRLGLASVYEHIDVNRAEREYRDILAVLELTESSSPKPSDELSDTKPVSLKPESNHNRGYISSQYFGALADRNQVSSRNLVSEPQVIEKIRGYVYFRLGNLYLKEEKWGEAVTNYDRAINSGCRLFPLYNKLAAAYKGLGDLEETKFYFQDILFRSGIAGSSTKMGSVLKWYDLGIKRLSESGFDKSDLSGLDDLNQTRTVFLEKYRP